MNTPQIILIVLMAMSGTVVLVEHGKPRGNYNFFLWLLSMFIEVGLLYWGGFFG